MKEQLLTVRKVPSLIHRLVTNLRIYFINANNKLSRQTRSDTSLSQIRKVYGKLWDILFPLVDNKESADPSNFFESSFDKDNQDTEAKNDLKGNKNATADQKDKSEPKKKKKPMNSVINFSKTIY